MECLIKPLLEIREYNEILNSITNYTAPVNVAGLSDSQKAHAAYSICEHLKCRGVFITFNEMQARKMYEDFSFFLGEDALFFPTKEIMLHEIEAKSYDSVFQRIKTLGRIIDGRYRIVVASAEAVMQKLVNKDVFIADILKFSPGMKLDIADLAKKLVMAGYERKHIVDGKGQFAIRGGIIDVFSVDEDHAVRTELFDDEIDSMRKFNINSQRSFDKLGKIRILPARDVIYPAERIDPIIKDIENDLADYIKKINGKSTEHIKQIKTKIEADINKIKSNHYFPGMDRFIHYFINDPHDLTQYAKDAVVIVDEPVRFRQRIDNVLLEHYETCKSLIGKGQILPESVEVFFDFESIDKRINKSKVINLSVFPFDNQMAGKCKNYSITAKSAGAYQGHMGMLVDDIKHWKEKKSRVVVLSGTRGRGERLAETLHSEGLEPVYMENGCSIVQPGQVIITRGSLNKGFEYPEIGLVVVSDKEVFGAGRKFKKVSGKKEGSRIKAFTDLNQGDYVVHQAHGIGRYVGIQKLVVENVKRDYIKIKYQESDYLYIPTSQLDLIQKYIGSEGKTPKLNKLGGTEWLRTKTRVKESLKELAAGLVKLYAQRQSINGHVFGRDTIWQKQFEELFPYEETEDQLKCVEEIKADMESGRPMDRLLCGDVGYGKTEVAIRAVFKAVMDGKQAAYLVPTTVLAQQHYNNFKARMAEFPVTVDVISRFRTQAEQKRILKNLKSGNADVLIGTHRLLQKDIAFKDLGLLVVDEEQRFGVSHKERLKNIKPEVDVLTLTATPIPRTLHMSLTGIRDISVIEDPPEERYPVQTYVMEYDTDVIRDAIYRELGRKGQVFYLSNRVRSIQMKAAQLHMLVPEAKIVVGHGQMEERQLENVMLDFVNGEYDILVCTTIIESGLDMPNVNTIIVEDADKMGLAQLYQLRGRVGRSNRLAYAYITYKKDKVLQELAEKRLQAIKEFTEFGSGFKIAMRDLEIRGAGNLLGPEQHGHMESVGYDMYCRLLDETVREIRGETFTREDVETSIDINISAYIDDDYIDTEEQKIEMYKKIAAIQDANDILDVKDELIDRFGDIPPPVQNLISVASIKILAKDAGFSAILEKNDGILFQHRQGKTINVKTMSKLSAKYKRQLLFNAGANPYLFYKTSGSKRENLLDNITILLQDVKCFAV